MSESDLLLIGSVILACAVLLGGWLVRKIRRGEIEVGVHTMLLALLAAILLVPFAMNVTAHWIANSQHLTAGENHGGQPEDMASAHRHDPL